MIYMCDSKVISKVTGSYEVESSEHELVSGRSLYHIYLYVDV